jgi:hypothetical protein
VCVCVFVCVCVCWGAGATLVGKDRTGVLAALILSLLGVDDELVCWDYEQTELVLRRTSACRGQQPPYGALMRAALRARWDTQTRTTSWTDWS